MKYLTLIRHAKSTHDDPMLPDAQRPLNARGQRDAPAMGRHLHTTFRFAPDRIVSSPATRAMMTARCIAEAIGVSEWDIKQEESIYEAPVDSLLAVIRRQNPAHRHICIVGHNPGMELLTNWLCGTTAVENVVTCAVIMLQLKVNAWSDAEAGCAIMSEYLYPELLKLTGNL